MTLVDRYITWIFARAFLISFAALLGMYLVADFVNNLAELLRYGETHGGLGRVVLDYYGPQVPWFFELISRMVALIAGVFAITWLQRNNEMAALMAAGVSRWRIIKPIFVATVGVALLAAVNRELVIPRLSRMLQRDARNYAGDRPETFHPRYDHATNIFLDGRAVLPGTRQIDRPKFRLPTQLAPRGTQLVAEIAEHLPATPDHPAGYLLRGVTKPARVSQMATIRDGGGPIVFGPLDTPWLEPNQIFVVSDLPFTQLREGSDWRRFSSTWALISGARNPSLGYGADISVTIHSRLVQPAMDVLLLFLGVPIVLARESRNPFIAAGMCLVMATIFLVFVLACQGMGMNYLMPPSLAAWCPLMIFVPVAMLMSEPLRR